MSNAYFRNFKTHSQSDKAKRMPAESRKEILKLVVPAEPSCAPEVKEEAKASPQKQGVYGYIFQSGPQILAVSVPGDVVPVRFSNHTVLKGLAHDDNSSDIIVMVSGVYEISYSVTMRAANALHLALSLQADGQTIDGSVMARLIDTREAVYGTAVLTELDAGATVRLIMTSGTVAAAQLSDSGVSASIMIKKLD